MLDCISWLQARNLNCEEWVLHTTLEEEDGKLSRDGTRSTFTNIVQIQGTNMETLDVFDPLCPLRGLCVP